MSRILVIALLSWCTAAEAAPQRWSLSDAVRQALSVDPYVGEAKVQEHSARVGVLRAQLDRFSLTVDGSVQELWQRNDIGRPASAQCLTLQALAATDEQSCAAANGVWNPNALLTGYSNLSARLSFFLFSGFRVEAGVARAKSSEKAALTLIRQQQHETALGVARAYWTVRRLMMKVEVQKETLQRLADAEGYAATRQRSGLSSPIDKNRATSRRLQQAALVEDLQGQVRANLAQLAVVLGVRGELELIDEPHIPDQPPATVDELLPRGFARRTDLLNAKLQVEIQRQRVRIARSTYYPQLTLLSLFQYGNNPYDLATGVYKPLTNAANPFDAMSGSFVAGGVLTINFFDTLNTFTATSDARDEQLRLQHEVRRFGRLVDSDVRSGHATLLKLYAQRAPLVAALDVARDNLKILESRYRNGDAAIIDYLDAQIDLANVESQLADLTGQLQLQWLELQAALGNIVGMDHD